jgi:hypothetical protein
MKTVLKIPVYLCIDHDNKNRMEVVKSVENLVVPELKSVLIEFSQSLQISPSIHQELSTSLGNYSLRLIDEVDALDKRK